MTLIKAKEKKKMKTRSNMPLFVLECEDIKALSNSQIDLLRCGDYLVKKDASGEHAYKVTFKSDTGMCLTYHDASVIETQSYDKVNGNWVYNSEDKTENLLENVKPIYCHPITILGAGTTSKTRVTCLIFNNLSEVFTKQSFADWVEEIGSFTDNFRIMLSGAFKNSTNDMCVASYLVYIKDTEKFTIIGYNMDDKVDETYAFTKEDFISYIDQFFDGVNKIN